MTVLAYYLVKVVICSGILFLYYQLAMRNKAFHQWNRFYLLFAVAASILLPLLQVTLSLGEAEPNSAIQLVKTVQSADEYLEEIVITGRSLPSPEQWLALLYGTVCFSLLVGFFRSIRKVMRLIRAHNIMVLDNIKFVSTTAEGTPFSFLNYIVWNNNISLQSTTGQQIFKHELVHVEERHTLDKLLLQVVLILFWCNPFFWLIRKELRFIHEFIADEKAVAEHGTAAFAEMILQAAYPQQFQSLTNPFFQTPIKRRLAMLTKLQNPKLNYFSRLIALPVIAVTVFAFTLRVDAVPTAALDQDFVVVIDAGHGKTTAGNFSGAHLRDVYEDALVLALAKKIKAQNTNSRIRVVLSRTSDDLVGLQDRVAVAAAEHANLFLSLHMNAAEATGGKRTNGIEVCLASKPTQYKQQSEVIGSALQQQLKTLRTTYPMLLKANAWVLNQNVCPSVLLEVGYVTDETDLQFLSNEANQKRVANKILTAINQFAGSQRATGVTTMIRDTVPSNQKKIVAVDVKKGPATVTLKYEDGTSETITEQEARNRGLLREPGSVRVAIGHSQDAGINRKPGAPDPLFILDGKEILKAEMYQLDPNTIASVNVLKGPSATEKYGDKGKNGVVEITLKDEKQEGNGPIVGNKPSSSGNEIVVEGHPLSNSSANNSIGENTNASQTDTPASIDKEKWREFLKKNLLPIISNAAAKGAKPGKYTVNLRFLVKKDGSLSKFEALNHPGYDLDKQLLAIMPNSPKWNPAEQNGKPVNSYHQQPVTFVIQEN